MSGRDRGTIRDFRDGTVRAFDFLLAQYAFRMAATEYRALGPGTLADPIAVDDAPGARLGDGIVTVYFESAEVVVEVSDDPRMETTCQLYRLAAPQESKVDLWHVRSFAGAGGEPLYEWGRTGPDRVLEALARALERYGGPWLRGEPLAWSALLRWWADGMPASRPHV